VAILHAADEEDTSKEGSAKESNEDWDAELMFIEVLNLGAGDLLLGHLNVLLVVIKGSVPLAE